MAYPKHLINDGEDIAVDLRPHWWFFQKQLLTGLPLVVAAIGTAIGLDGNARTRVGYGVGAAGIVRAIWLLKKLAQWLTTYFVVTTDRVIYRTGVLSKRGVEIPLERVNNINFGQNFWERIIGAGDLEVESAGRDGQTVFSNVRHPDGVQQELYRQMESSAKRRAQWSAPPAPEAPATNEPTAAQRIEALTKLKADGHITEEEFQAKRSKLLEEL